MKKLWIKSKLAKQILDRFTRKQEIEASDVLNKARGHKYIYRFPSKRSDRNWEHVYKKDFSSPMRALLSIFSIKKERINTDYEKNNIKQEYGADKKTFAAHILAYFANKAKWDGFFSKKENSQKYSKPEKKTSVATASAKPTKPTGKKTESGKEKLPIEINRSLMRKVWEIYNPKAAEKNKSPMNEPIKTTNWGLEWKEGINENIKKEGMPIFRQLESEFDVSYVADFIRAGEKVVAVNDDGSYSEPITNPDTLRDLMGYGKEVMIRQTLAGAEKILDSIAEEHRNRSEAMKGNQNAEKDGIADDDYFKKQNGLEGGLSKDELSELKAGDTLRVLIPSKEGEVKVKEVAADRGQVKVRINGKYEWIHRSHLERLSEAMQGNQNAKKDFIDGVMNLQNGKVMIGVEPDGRKWSYTRIDDDNYGIISAMPNGEGLTSTEFEIMQGANGLYAVYANSDRDMNAPIDRTLLGQFTTKDEARKQMMRSIEVDIPDEIEQIAANQEIRNADRLSEEKDSGEIATSKQMKAEQANEKKARKKAGMPPTELFDRSSAMEDSTWNPKSEDYRYKDTGYIAGSRKEMATSHIKRMAKEGAHILETEIDWQGIEENPRQAKLLITKSNIFGRVDWSALQTAGMTGGAGFLIDRIYASVGAEPTEDNAEARHNYSIAVDGLRDRFEKCKTVEDVTNTIKEIRDELNGDFVSAKESPEVMALSQKLQELRTRRRELQNEEESIISQKGREETELEKKAQKYYEAEVEKARQKDKRKKRVSEYDFPPEARAEYNRLLVEARTENRNKFLEFRKKNGFLDDEDITDNFGKVRGYKNRGYLFNEIKEVEAQRQEIYGKMAAEIRLANPLHMAWTQLGDKFDNILGNGSDSFLNHRATARRGTYDNWEWASKDKIEINRKGEKRRAKFELKVASRLERKGGREIISQTTTDLKNSFNLRDVQSGDWILNDPEAAKFHVDNITSGFADLGDMTGIPDGLLSMNGRLAIAIGARGHGSSGWKTGAPMAHYEPVERVINLTKMKGGGCLAHEWWHAFDNLISEAMTGGEIDKFLTDPVEPGLSAKQRQLKKEVDRLKNMDMGSVFNQYNYKQAVKNAIEAGVNIAEPGSEEEHIERVKAAFNNLVKAMTEGDTPLMTKICYTEDDYRLAKANLTNPIGDFKKRITEAGSLDKALDIVYARNLSPKDQKKWAILTAAYYDGKSEGNALYATNGKKGSFFKKAAHDLDAGGGKPYYSQQKEMAARAFSAYVDDKLRQGGRLNDYLAYATTNDFYVDPIWGPSYPYPQGEERERINAAFEELFKVVNETGAIRKALSSKILRGSKPMKLYILKSLGKAIREGEKLKYFKKLIMDHLDKFEDGDVMEKGKKLPIGTIREWKGQKYIKTADTKHPWKPKYDSVSRGAKSAVTRLKGKIAASKDVNELLLIIIDNKERFSDKNGNPLPFVNELEEYANKIVGERGDAISARNEGKKPGPGKGNRKTGAERYNDRLHRIMEPGIKMYSRQEEIMKEKGVDKEEAHFLWLEETSGKKVADEARERASPSEPEKEGKKDHITLKDFEKISGKAAMVFPIAGSNGKTRYNVMNPEYKERRTFDYFDEAAKYAVEIAGGDKSMVFGYDGKPLDSVKDDQLKDNTKLTPMYLVGVDRLNEQSPKSNYTGGTRSARLNRVKDDYAAGKIDIDTTVKEYMAIYPKLKKEDAEKVVRRQFEQLKSQVYSGDFTNDEKSKYLDQKAPDAQDGACAVLDNEMWRKDNGKWDFIFSGGSGRSNAKSNHEQILQETKEVFAKDKPIVVTELSKEYEQHIDGKLTEIRENRRKEHEKQILQEAKEKKTRDDFAKLDAARKADKKRMANEVIMLESKKAEKTKSDVFEILGKMRDEAQKQLEYELKMSKNDNPNREQINARIKHYIQNNTAFYRYLENDAYNMLVNLEIKEDMIPKLLELFLTRPGDGQMQMLRGHKEEIIAEAEKALKNAKEKISDGRKKQLKKALGGTRRKKRLVVRKGVFA